MVYGIFYVDPGCHVDCLGGLLYVALGLFILGITFATLLWLRLLNFFKSKLPPKQKNRIFWKIIEILITMGIIWVVFYQFVT